MGLPMASNSELGDSLHPAPWPSAKPLLHQTQEVSGFHHASDVSAFGYEISLIKQILRWVKPRGGAPSHPLDTVSFIYIMYDAETRKHRLWI